jgi:hypothetical protein
MSENLHINSPEGAPATFDALYTLSSAIRDARPADQKDRLPGLRRQVQQLYNNSTYEELRAVYSQMCLAYRSNEDPQSENFDPTIRSAWIDLHAHLEQRYPKECERGGELFAIDVSALEQQAAARADIEQGTMPEQGAMPQRIEPPLSS